MCRSDLKGCLVGTASLKTPAVDWPAGVFCNNRCKGFGGIVSLLSNVDCTENVVVQLQFLQADVGKKPKAYSKASKSY